MGGGHRDLAAVAAAQQLTAAAARARQLQLVLPAGDQVAVGGGHTAHRRHGDRDTGLVPTGLHHAADLHLLPAAHAHRCAAAAGTDMALQADAVVAADLQAAAIAADEDLSGCFHHQAAAAQTEGGAGILPARQAAHHDLQLIHGLEGAAQLQQLPGGEGEVAAGAAGLDQAGEALAVAAADRDGAGGVGAEDLAAAGELQVDLTGAAAGGLGADADLQAVGGLHRAGDPQRFARCDRDRTAAALGLDQGALIKALAMTAAEGDGTGGIGGDQLTDGSADRLQFQAEAGGRQGGETAVVTVGHGHAQLIAGLQGTADLYTTLGVDGQIGAGGIGGAAGGDCAGQHLAVAAVQGDGAGGGGGA